MLGIFRKRKGGSTEKIERVEVAAAPAGAGLAERISASRDSLGARLADALRAAGRIDEDLIEALEAVLLSADLGVPVTERIVSALRAGITDGRIAGPQAVLPAVQAELFDIIEPCEQPLDPGSTHQPFVLMVVGVNGVGKTTTIAKLAQRWKEEGRSVLLGAGDTFRAAAIAQLCAWGERLDVPVIAQQQGGDPGAVIFDSMQAARARNSDILIADTAGRLHTQSNLMEELKKVRRVMQRHDQSAPHETLLVVDASTGQNALQQAREFNKAVPLTGIAITKLDGTARGGVLFAIAEALGLPIRFIGVGEKAGDLRPFDAASFIDAILPAG